MLYYAVITILVSDVYPSKHVKPSTLDMKHEAIATNGAIGRYDRGSWPLLGARGRY